MGLLLLGLSVIGCGDDPKQMFETAQFEELQNNQGHARELYQRIIEADPDSEWAKKARDRLAALQRK
ncbi:MAG: hypothetical protein GTO40_12750 [Deltaproteobacteria bacterium]|nr:hypothetical protein [Deltaproteobacteria bacterium]